MRSGAEHLTNQELMRLIEAQERRIAVLQRRVRVWLLVALIILTAVTGVGSVALAGTGASDLIHSCYETRSRGLFLALPNGTCPKGDKPLSWDQYVQVGATSPLSVTAGSGTAPVISLTGRIPATQGGEPEVIGTSPLPSELVSDGRHIWVASQIFPTVDEISLATHNRVAELTLSSGVSGAAYDGRHLWFSERSAIAEVDPIGRTILSEIPDAEAPEGVAFDGSHVWVSNANSDTVSEIDPATAKVIDTVFVGGEPEGLYFDGRDLWVADFESNTISEIDPVSARVVATVGNLQSPWAITSDGRDLWVVPNNASTADEVDPTSLKTVASVTIGDSGVTSVNGVVFDGSHIWVSSGADSISEISPKAHAVVGAIPVDGSPEAIIFADKHLWVANPGNDTLSVI